MSSPISCNCAAHPSRLAASGEAILQLRALCRSNPSAVLATRSACAISTLKRFANATALLSRASSCCNRPRYSYSKPSRNAPSDTRIRSTRNAVSSSTRIARPPGHTCARRSDRPGNDMSAMHSNLSTLSISASTAPGVRSFDAIMPSSRATASLARIVPEVPVDSTFFEFLKNAFTGLNFRRTATRASSNACLLIRPPGK